MISIKNEYLKNNNKIANKNDYNTINIKNLSVKLNNASDNMLKLNNSHFLEKQIINSYNDKKNYIIII